MVIDHESGTSLHLLPLTSEELDAPSDPGGALGSPQTTTQGIRGVEPTDAGPSSWRVSTLRQLYQKVVGPFRNELTGMGLLIVPYGSLAQVPFGALRDADSFLVEDFALAQIPSVAALKIWKARQIRGQPGREVEVLGPPDELESPLLGARREALMVADLFDVTAKLGRRAAEADLYANAPDLGVLHIATHGEFPAENPLFGRLHLASGNGQDGFLAFHEIWDRLDLRRAQLVTLSGCETGLGDLTRGDDVLGLTTAFLAAGSRSVVSTLWQVSDQPSAELMIAFYENWLSGQPLAVALREAQLNFLGSNGPNRRFGSWAGYVLTGDPTTRWPLE